MASPQERAPPTMPVTKSIIFPPYIHITARLSHRSIIETDGADTNAINKEQILHLAQYALSAIRAGINSCLANIIAARSDWAEAGVGETEVWGIWWDWFEAEEAESLEVQAREVEVTVDRQGKLTRTPPGSHMCHTASSISPTSTHNPILSAGSIKAPVAPPSSNLFATILHKPVQIPSSPGINEVGRISSTNTPAPKFAFEPLSSSLAASIEKVIQRSKKSSPMDGIAEILDTAAIAAPPLAMASSDMGSVSTSSAKAQVKDLHNNEEPNTSVEISIAPLLTTESGSSGFVVTAASMNPSAVQSVSSENTFQAAHQEDDDPDQIVSLHRFQSPTGTRDLFSPISRHRRRFEKSMRPQTVTPPPGLFDKLDIDMVMARLFGDGSGVKTFGKAGRSGVPLEEKAELFHRVGVVITAEEINGIDGHTAGTVRSDHWITDQAPEPDQTHEGEDDPPYGFDDDEDEFMSESGRDEAGTVVHLATNRTPPATPMQVAQVNPQALDVIVFEDDDDDDDNTDESSVPLQGVAVSKGAGDARWRDAAIISDDDESDIEFIPGVQGKGRKKRVMMEASVKESPRTERVRESIERASIADSDDDEMEGGMLGSGLGGCARKRIKVDRMDLGRVHPEPWTCYQHIALVDHLLMIAKPAGAHWIGIAQRVAAVGSHRDVKVIKQTWNQTDYQAFKNCAVRGELYTLANVKSARLTAWKTEEKIALWQALLLAGSKMANWNEVAESVNANGPPRDATAVKKTWISTLKPKYGLK